MAHLIETHFPGATPHVADEETQEESSSHPSYDKWKLARQIVDEKGVKWAIETFKPFKAAGPDKIFPALLQHGLEIITKPLTNIFIVSIAFGYIPKAWREVKVVFIPKPGRASYEDAKSYRAISLSSFVLKVLERLVGRFITESCLKSKPLQENQLAYQKGKSTNSAIHKVTQYIEGGLNNGEPVLGVFLDIEGAFDRTKYEAIKRSAQEHAVPIPIIDWVSNMLKHRTLRADLKGICVRMTPTRGCPQGGIASPRFWIMVADSLMKRLKESGYYTIGYADDFAILVKGKFIGAVFDRMRFAMKIQSES